MHEKYCSRRSSILSPNLRTTGTERVNNEFTVALIAQGENECYWANVMQLMIFMHTKFSYAFHDQFTDILQNIQDPDIPEDVKKTTFAHRLFKLYSGMRYKDGHNKEGRSWGLAFPMLCAIVCSGFLDASCSVMSFSGGRAQMDAPIKPLHFRYIPPAHFAGPRATRSTSNLIQSTKNLKDFISSIDNLGYKLFGGILGITGSSEESERGGHYVTFVLDKTNEYTFIDTVKRPEETQVKRSLEKINYKGTVDELILLYYMSPNEHVDLQDEFTKLHLGHVSGHTDGTPSRRGAGAPPTPET